MIQTNLTTVDVSPDGESTVEILASTPSTTTVVVGEDGVIALNTIQSPGVEVLAASPATVNISVVQESAVVITTDPTNDTTVIVDENGVVTINTIEDTAVQISTTPQHVIVLEPIEEVAVVLVTAAQQGPAGPVGPIGPAGGTQLYQAGQNLLPYEVVYVQPNGQVAPASSTNIAYYGTIVGITTQAYSSGMYANIANNGVAQNPAWSFTPGQKVYVGVNGMLTDTLPPGAVFSQAIGTALSTNSMFVSVEPPVLINGGLNINSQAALYSSYSSAWSTSTVVIDSFSAVLFRSAKYQIQISDGVNFETLEMFVLHDGVNVFLSSYGNVFTTPLSQGHFDALMSTNTVSVSFTPTTATNKTIKFIRSAITV